MPLGRRSFIRIAGTSAVIMAAGAGTFALTREPTGAVAPWRNAGEHYADPRMRALSYAILAPNPHNRQPWLVDLGGEGDVVLYCDHERLLPETDPFSRQIVIGLGCFLELLRMAAAEDGYRAEIAPFPDGEPGDALDQRPVARVTFRKDGEIARDPLFAQVFARRSTKEPFDIDRPVTKPSLAALQSLDVGDLIIGATNDSERVSALRDLTWRAHVVEVETPRTLMESVRLMRIGRSEIEASPDGIDLGGPFLETLNVLGVLNRETLADPRSSAFAQGMDMYREIMETAMAHVWILSDGNGRTKQLDTGRAWVRLNLKATELGLGLHPVSQALQEYPEMDALFAEIHERLGARDGQRVQMLGRLGYGPKVGPSPRWPVEARIKEV